MTLSHDIDFTFELALDCASAVRFVQDARGSLRHAGFIEGLQVHPSRPETVEATIPVNAALFGQRHLPFKSRLHRSPTGALLAGLALPDHKPGWAEVAGEAVVAPCGRGSLVSYRFSITIHLDLPVPEKWGGRALTKMIEYTASTVLSRITSQFPEAVQQAATEYAAAVA